MSCLNLNKVILAGRLTSDPELKTTASGVSVTSFSLAVNRPQGKDDTARKTDFITILAWRKTAEFVTRFFKKGSAICISGSIQTRQWEDSNKCKRTSVEVVASEAMFVDSKSEASENHKAEADYIPDAYTNTDNSAFTEISETDGDLPF